MDYELLGRVMELILLDEFYDKATVHGTRNSVYCAIKHGKCLTHWSEDKLIGYCTYGFFTQEELDSRNWDGDEVYRRSEGGVLYFPKFQCRAGRREVVRFIRSIQLFLSEQYPDCETGVGLRVYPDRTTRSEKWYRKPSC